MPEVTEKQKPAQQTPLWFRVAVGVVLPGLLVAVGLHDLIAGETLFIFSSSEFRQNVARYALVESAARISGAAMIGLGIGIGLRNLAGLIGRKQLPSDSLAVPT